MLFNSRKHLLILSLFICMLLVIPCSFASDNVTDDGAVLAVGSDSVYVSVDGNDNSGNGSFDNPYQSVNKAVEVYNSSVNSNIYIMDGNYLFDEKVTVGKNINFIGQSRDSVILDAGYEFSLFDVSSNTVGFYNLTFINADNGAAVHVSSTRTTTFDNCAFLNNDNGAISSSAGASEWYPANIVVKNSQFINNSKMDSYYGDGAAISISSIYSSLNADNCTFKDNSAYGSGGAIDLSNVRCESFIQNSRFINNTADEASAINIFNGYDTTIKNCVFINNTASEGSSVINDGYSYSQRKLYLGNNVFENNNPETEVIASSSIEIVYLDNNDKILASDIDMNFGDNVNFIVRFTDSNGNPISGKKITVTLTDYFKKVSTYSGITNANGQVVISLSGQEAGTYNAVSSFEGDSEYDAVSIINIVKIKAEHSYNIVFNESIVKVGAGEHHMVTATTCGPYMTPVIFFTTYNFAWITHSGYASYSLGHTLSGSTFTFDVLDFGLSTQLQYYRINVTATEDTNGYTATGVLLVDTSIPLPPVDENISVIYVSPDGSDESGDGTESNPLATLQTALYVNEAYNGNKIIYLKEGVYEISNVEVFGNVTVIGEKSKSIIKQLPSDEGMFYLDNHATVKFINVTFIDGYMAPLTIYTAVFVITYEDSIVYFDGCEFYNNTGSAYGVIYVSGGAKLYVNNCIFANNSGVSLNPAGVICTVSGNLEVSNSYFYNNTGTEGGALLIGPGSYANIVNSTFYRNTALNDTSAMSGGGAIFVNNHYTSIYNCSFIENYAELNGGAIYILVGEVDIQKSLFENNRVGPGSSKGSAIASDSGYTVFLNVEDSILTANDYSRLIYIITSLNEDSEAVLNNNYWGTNSYSTYDPWVIITASKDKDEVYEGDVVEITVEFKGNAADLENSVHDYLLNLTANIGTLDSDSITISDNVAKFKYYATANGTATITMTRDGKTRYTYTFDVNGNGTSKVDANVSVTVNETDITVEVPTDLENNITIRVNDVDYSLKAVNGTAVLSIAEFLPGNYTVTVSYEGDEKYNAALYDSIASFEIAKYEADLNVFVNDTLFGDDIIVNVTANANLSGKVTVTVYGKSYTVNVVNGSGSVKIDYLAIGDYEVIAVFEGNNYFLNDEATTSFTVSENEVGIIYVSADGTPEGNGSKSNPFSTISEALDLNKRLGGNKTIIVESGNYVLNRVAINENVTIIGNGSVIIAPSYNTNHLYIGGDADVRLESLTFINGNGLVSGVIDMGDDNKGNLAKKLTVINCTFVNNTGVVGAISSYADTTILKSTFINNTATGTTGFNQGLISIQDNDAYLEYNIFLNNMVSSQLIVSEVYGVANNNFWNSNDRPEGISNNMEINSWAVIIPSIDDDVRTKTNYDLAVEFLKTTDGVNFAELDDSMPDLEVTVEAARGNLSPVNLVISDNIAISNYNVTKKGMEAISVYLEGNLVSNITFYVDVIESDKIYVAKYGSDENTGSKDSPLATIKEALAMNKAMGGNKTIIILEGDYQESNLVIDTLVEIIGYDASVTGGDVFTVSAKTVIDNLIINGNVNHENGTLEFDNSTINGNVVSNKYIVIYNSTFNDASIVSNATVIYISNFNNSTVEVSGLCAIANSTFEDGSSIISKANYCAIEGNVFKSTETAIETYGSEIVLSHNEFSSSEVSFIYSDVILIGNTNVTINVVNSTVTNTVVTFLENSTVISDSGLIQLNATVRDKMGNVINGGKVTFMADDDVIGEADVVNGSAFISYTFDSGDYVISGNYSANKKALIRTGLLRLDVEYFWFIDGVGYETLADAINASKIGDVIKGVPGEYYVDRMPIGHRYYSLEPWEIIKSVTITSLNDTPVTLIGKNVQVFFIDVGSELTLKNVIVKDSGTMSEYGGVVESFDHANLTIINCTFINNTAEEGGVLFIQGDLYVRDSVFDSNKGLVGGAIYVATKNEVTLENAVFKNNYAPYGGAFYNSGTVVDMYNATFINNTAFVGGALFANGGETRIDDSNFISNNALMDSERSGLALGGAVHNMLADTFFRNTNFINNHADDLGGAVELENSNYIGITWATFDNCTFVNNTASEGGAMFMGNYYEPYVNITASVFESNTAELNGAAISNNYAHLIIKDTEFNKNTITTGSDLIHVIGNYIESTSYNAYLTVLNSSFNNNDVEYDIYLANSYSILELSTSTFNGENSILYNKGEASLVDNTVVNSIGDNVIINNGTLKLYTNEFDTPILNGNYILTPTFIKVLNNETVSGVVGKNYLLTAVVVDDNDNLIEKGNLEFIIDGKRIKAVYENREYVANYTVTEGSHVVSADYDDEGLVYINIKTGLLISKKSSDLAVDVNAPVVGEDAVINITVNPQASGNVTANVNNETYTLNIENGKASLTVSNLTEGNYTVEISYSGDDDFAPENITSTLTVNKVSEYEMDVNISSVEVGKNATVTVTLPEDATGNVSVDINNNTYSADVENGTAVVIIPDLEIGNYTLNITYSGDDKYSQKTVTDNITIENTISIIVNDLEKYAKGPERFNVTLLDKDSNPIVGADVIISINAMNYTRTTDATGVASIAVNLNAGTYNVTVYYDNKTADAKIIVKPTVYGSDITKMFRNGTQYYATFLDSEGNPLANGTEVKFNINGVMYTRAISGDEGKARLNINLVAGEYIITAINTNGDMAANTIKVLPIIADNKNVTKYFRNDTQYYVTILDEQGNPVGAGVDVTFNINGVMYKRQTNESGVARLNLNLNPGDYVITAMYNGCVVSNTVKILPILYASDLNMHFRDGSKFEAKLVDGQGNALSDATISFNINGVLYKRVTDVDGIARLNINLVQGKYIITSSYNGSSISNTITIS